MKVSKRDTFKVGEQAALHLLRTNETDSPQTQAEFDAWVKVSTHHVHEMLFAELTSAQLDGIDPKRTIDVDSLPTPPELIPTIEGYEPAAPLEYDDRPPAGRRSKWSSPSHWSWPARAAAASICVGVLVTALVLWQHFGAYSTGLGEQRTVKLGDGSVMILNTNSRAEVDFSKHERAVHLYKGEALFIVEHDETRPFRVFADSVITAVGTRFNVDRHTGKTRVAVIEGQVRVSPPGEGSLLLLPKAVDPPADNSPTIRLPQSEATEVALRAGDEAVVDEGRVVKTFNPDIQRAIAWQSRELIFRGNPLSEVVDEFNRYNVTAVRVEGDEQRMQNVSGVFSADDVQTLLVFLEDDPRFEVIRGESEIVIRSRNLEALPAQ